MLYWKMIALNNDPLVHETINNDFKYAQNIVSVKNKIKFPNFESHCLFLETAILIEFIETHF